MDEPKTARGRQTRAAIIQTAARLMYDRGVRATSLDDVLDASGCGKSQLYHYSAGRSELLAAVAEYQLQSILVGERRAARTRTPGQPRTRLRRTERDR